MTRDEFALIMAYVSVSVGKPLSEDAAEVYYDLLGDLPVEAMQISAKRVVLEHRWATFPLPAEFRQAAAETMRGKINELSPPEAWALAWEAAGKIDAEIDGSIDRACQSLPPLVFEAMRAFGINAIAYGREPVGMVRTQFLKIFEQLQSRDRRQALLPVSMVQAIERIGTTSSLPGIGGNLAKQIGRAV